MSVVLVVDDDRDLREAICETLEDEGVRTIGAADGAEALAVLRRGDEVRLVLLDLMMPVMTGWEFRHQQLRDEKLASVPVVVMTAAANLATKPVSADAVLHKPIGRETLLATVQRFARR